MLQTNYIFCTANRAFPRCVNSTVAYSGTDPETRQTYWFLDPSEVLTLDWAHCGVSATLPTTANCTSLNDTGVSLSLNAMYSKGSGTSIIVQPHSRRSAIMLWMCFSSSTIAAYKSNFLFSFIGCIDDTCYKNAEVSTVGRYWQWCLWPGAMFDCVINNVKHVHDMYAFSGFCAFYCIFLSIDRITSLIPHCSTSAAANIYFMQTSALCNWAMLHTPETEYSVREIKDCLMLKDTKNQS